MVFLGDADKLIPTKTMQRFVDAMKAAGARCELHLYAGAGHGFFNRDPHYTQTLIEADRFLASLGWLAGPPTLTAP